jgi:hypothetical protein
MYCQSNFIAIHLKKKNQMFLYNLICQSKQFLLFVNFRLKLFLLLIIRYRKIYHIIQEHEIIRSKRKKKKVLRQMESYKVQFIVEYDVNLKNKKKKKNWMLESH